ncbi:MAG: FliA/WhiG family RNA polymerase sigma factor [Deltaproteobacteria bacterium]|nr:FliA/WhiG family RNA polymerase sigma factor [Deltaproteobacteria bacterium]
MPKGCSTAEAKQDSDEIKMSSQEREQLILKYAPLIKYIANRIAARLPVHIDIQDMINSGVLGLMDAIEKFDPEKGVKFETYAEYRVKGAILDSLRAMDWVPRSVRKVATMLENTYADLEKRLGRPATDDEVAKAMNVGVDRLHKIVNRVSNVSMISLERDEKNDSARHSLLDRLMDADSVTAFDKLDSEELRELLAECIENMPEKEKTVISLYYFNELTMKDIGKILKLTESRVSQIHTKAVIRLRGKLRKAYSA